MTDSPPPENAMHCDRCGNPMRLLNRPRGRVLVYFCGLCARFAEVPRR